MILGEYGASVQRSVRLCGKNYEAGEYIEPEVLEEVPQANLHALQSINTLNIYSTPPGERELEFTKSKIQEPTTTQKPAKKTADSEKTKSTGRKKLNKSKAKKTV